MALNNNHLTDTITPSTGTMNVSGTLSATSVSGAGSGLTGLNASNISSGTVAAARLGTGTANGDTFLRGDGGWASVGPKVAVFKSNGTWTAPTGVTTVFIDGAAGGGGGGGAATNANTAAGGGSAGESVLGHTLTVVPGTTYTITIGTGGAGGAAGDNDGSAGNDTSFDALLTLSGGNFGGKGTVPDGGASAGTGSSAGQRGTIFSGQPGAVGGAGGGNMYSAPAFIQQVGAWATTTSITGTNGLDYGGGGSGAIVGSAASAAAGGNGADGFLVVRW